MSADASTEVTPEAVVDRQVRLALELGRLRLRVQRGLAVLDQLAAATRDDVVDLDAWHARVRRALTEDPPAESS